MFMINQLDDIIYIDYCCHWNSNDVTMKSRRLQLFGFYN